MSVLGSRHDFEVACPNSLGASTACQVKDRWFTPHVLIFIFVSGLLKFLFLGSLSLLGVLAGLMLLIGLHLFFQGGQDAWIFLGRSWVQFLPDLIFAVRAPYLANSVDRFWCVWSAGAEAGLLTAYRRAAGLALQVWRRCLGGRAVGGGAASKLYRVSRGDEVDAAWVQYFVQLLLCSCAAFSGVGSSRWRMFLRVSSVTAPLTKVLCFALPSCVLGLA